MLTVSESLNRLLSHVGAYLIGCECSLCSLFSRLATNPTSTLTFSLTYTLWLTTLMFSYQSLLLFSYIFRLSKLFSFRVSIILVRTLTRLIRTSSMLLSRLILMVGCSKPSFILSTISSSFTTSFTFFSLSCFLSVWPVMEFFTSTG